MKDKQFNMRVPEGYIQRIKDISKKESEKTGYKVSCADILRKAIKEFIEKTNA
jgi:predicted DNA-binding protein